MIERTDLVFLLISLFCVAIALGSNPLFPKCERDTDCPPEFSCKLVCNSSCNSLCVPLKKISRRPQQPLRSRESTELDAAPFAANANPFAGAQADESSTPLTISEKELEAEFNKSGSSQPEPPPKFIAGPESEGSTAWTFAPGELAAGSTEQQISPPSFSPQPPAFSETTPVYKTNSTIQQSSTKQQSSFASSSESRELKEPPYTSSREKEAKETSKKRKGNAESFSRSLEILTITSTTSSPDNSQELEEETSCPAPPICGKNCGVIIDEDGCQTCRCLWTSGLCSTDFDCSGEGLFCDLGRCECKSGYEHDKEPGICKSIVKDKPTQQGIRLISTAGGIISGKAGKNLPVSRRLKKIANIHQNRARRSPPFEDKPMREERLQWPGPCESDEDCPPNLYCIQFDCWTIPEKPIRHIQGRRASRSEILRSFAMERHSPRVFTTHPSTSNDSPLDTSLTPPPRQVMFPAIRNDGKEIARPPSRSPPPITTPSPATLAQQYDKEIFDSEWDKTDDSSTTIATTTARSVEQVDSPESEDQFPTKQFPVELKESDTEPEKDKVEEEWHEMGLLNTTAAALPALTTTTPKDPRIFFDYSKENRLRKPVRVQMINAKVPKLVTAGASTFCDYFEGQWLKKKANLWNFYRLRHRTTNVYEMVHYEDQGVRCSTNSCKNFNTSNQCVLSSWRVGKSRGRQTSRQTRKTKRSNMFVI